jgi:hypothetical protein
MTKPTGRKHGRPPGAMKPFESDDDAHVLVIADLIMLSMPNTSRGHAIKLSVLWHYHERKEGPPDLIGMPARLKGLIKEGWHLRAFEKAPADKAEDDAPEEGFLRSEIKRVMEKERRLLANPRFQRWRKWAVLMIAQVSSGKQFDSGASAAGSVEARRIHKLMMRRRVNPGA